MDAWALVVGGYLAVAVLCVVGVLSGSYRDNALQRVGLIALCFGAIGRAVEISQLRWAAPTDALMCMGLALFGAGVVIKVRRHCRVTTGG